MKKFFAVFLAVLFVFGSFGNTFAGTVMEHEESPDRVYVSEPVCTPKPQAEENVAVPERQETPSVPTREVYSGTCGADGDNLTWTLDTETGVLEISGTGAMKNYTEYTYPWYSYRSCIISVIISDGVTCIGTYAFSWCSSLKSIVIPDTIASINGHAFYFCSALSHISLPSSLSFLGSYAFSNSALESICIPDNINAINSYTFQECVNLISVDIPDNVINIGNYAFEGCSSLTSLYIPDSVTNIGHSAFKSCSSLASVTLPSNLESIESFLFQGCSHLLSIVIPDSVTSIGSEAFAGCSKLSSIVLPEQVTSIGNYAFRFCYQLTEMRIPDEVSKVSDYMFQNCTSLKTVELGSKITTIGKNAFYDCYALESIIIPDGVTSIGEYAFYYCRSLTSVEIPHSTTSIGQMAFSMCSSLENLSLGSGVKSIGQYAFSNTKIRNISIPDSVTYIDGWAFQDTSLKTVTIGNGLTFLSWHTFEGCSSLETVSLGSSIKEIKYEAFYKCTKLMSIVLPEAINNISTYAFLDCSSLESAIFLGAPPSSFGTSVFGSCASNFTIYYTSVHASEWAPNGETTWNGYPIALLGDAEPTPEPTVAPTDEPYITIAPVVTPEPTELTKAEDMFYENCYIADIWLDRYDGEADCESPTVESQYFQNILEQESLCEILYNARVDDPVFNGMLAAWNGSILFFDPVGHVYKELEIQQTYEAVILDFISRTIEEEQEETDNILAEIIETDTWNELGTGLTLESKYHILLDLLLKAADLGNGILPPDLLTSLKSCDFAPTSDFWEKYDAIFKKHDYLSSWANDEVFRDIGLIVSVSTDTIDFLKRISTYYYLTDVSDEMQILLQEMYDQSNDESFRAAINSVLFKIRHTKWIDFVTAADYTVTVAGKALTEIAIGAIWKAFASEELMAAKIGYQVGKFLSNTMFNTQATIDKYYLVKATAEFISANKAAISSLAERYLDSGTEADAGAYLYAMRVYRYAAETDFESGKEFYSACEEEGLINRLDKFCKFVAMLLGADNQKSNYETLVDNIESILSSYDLMYKIAEFNWVNYLRVDYPQTYAELAPQILSDSDYKASIVCVNINENGETEVLWNLPNSYKDSSNNLHYIGTSLIDGVELTEIVNNETTVQTQQSDGGTCTFYNASSFDYFPKVYKIRSYTDTESGKVYSDYSEFVFDSPLKRVDLLVGKVNGETAIAILDITSGEYDVQYHIYRMNSIGEYDLIDTINRSSNKHLRNFTVYLDSTASNGRNRYKVVSELSFANGQSLFAESKETFSYQQETETVIDDISIRIVGRNFVRGIDGRNGYFLSDSEDSEITAYGYELTWEPYENAEGYQIYRKEAFGENYNLIAEVDGSETTYLDSTADVLLGYEFMIIPYTIEDGVKTVDTGNYAAGVLTHTVTFVDWDGTVLSEQTVEHSHGAEAPEVPGREGYAFIGWDHNVGNIQDDVTITALYGPRYGDIDCSGLISMADVTILSMYLNGENPTVSEPGMLNADANADGTVDIRDIAAIYAIIAAS